MTRAELLQRIEASRAAVIELAQALVRTDSQNPPGDTKAIVALIEKTLGAVEHRRVTGRAPMVNLVARIAGRAPGRRLVFNGHLDTFPAGAGWRDDPLSGAVRDGRLHGRGASDMKAGLAAAITTALILAEAREAWRGELVLALAADEETGGLWGTQHLLAHVPEARGDAMLCGDAGSPEVARIGEKGQIWLEVTAQGKAAHGAHVHLGDNAIEHLMAALDRLRSLRDLDGKMPDALRRVVQQAGPVSEKLSGIGESATLQHVTVNIGVVEGGSAVNLVPDAARALCDIRFPQGLAVADLVRAIEARIGAMPGVAFRVLSSCEPTITAPDHELVRLVTRNAGEALGRAAVANLRVGFSDSRFYRLAGVPTVVYGPTPHNMGGPDEYVTLDDLHAVFAVHALTAWDFLQ